jgi:Tfp pilus assembly protein PilN
MIRINLVPAPEGPKTHIGSRPSLPELRFDWVPKSPSLVAVGVGVAVLLVAVLLYSGERRAVSQARVAIVEAQSDSVRLHEVFVHVRSMEDAQRQLAFRLKRLEGVVHGRDYWPDLMETVSTTLPPYTWLERIDRADLQSDQIRIEGATFAAAAVTEYMRGLEASSTLDDVGLVGVVRAERDSFRIQEFTLVASFENYEPVVIAPPQLEDD